jgi:hypothetical protein
MKWTQSWRGLRLVRKPETPREHAVTCHAESPYRCLTAETARSRGFAGLDSVRATRMTFVKARPRINGVQEF